MYCMTKTRRRARLNEYLDEDGRPAGAGVVHVLALQSHDARYRRAADVNVQKRHLSHNVAVMLRMDDSSR